MTPLKFKALAENNDTEKKKWFYYGINSKPTLLGFHWISEDVQSTGLSDKKGEEIYEKDFVSVKGVTTMIIWDDNDLCFTWGNWELPEFPYAIREGIGVEIVGNYYENPELLNQKSS